MQAGATRVVSFGVDALGSSGRVRSSHKAREQSNGGAATVRCRAMDGWNRAEWRRCGGLDRLGTTDGGKSEALVFLRSMNVEKRLNNRGGCEKNRKFRCCDRFGPPEFLEGAAW